MKRLSYGQVTYLVSTLAAASHGFTTTTTTKGIHRSFSLVAHSCQQPLRKSFGMSSRHLLLDPRPPSSSSSSSSSDTSLYFMNRLQTIFGGGAYNLQIDYESLAFPCPELAQAAMIDSQPIPETSPSQPHLELATFAGGCFWGLELAFQRVEGVEYTAVGYTQGHEKRPTYEQVSAGNTGHTEAVCIYFDPKIVSYTKLLDVFLNRIDPTTVNGQGRDFGKMYRTGIYYHSEPQKILAHTALAKARSKHSRPIATECRQAKAFWPAEDYHQQYLEKGGRFGSPQSAEKNCTDEIRCYG